MDDETIEGWVDELEGLIDEAAPITKIDDTRTIKEKSLDILNTGADVYEFGGAAAEAYDKADIENSKYMVRSAISRAFLSDSFDTSRDRELAYDYFRKGWEDYSDKT